MIALAVGLAPIPADAQIYELIKVCKRKWQTAVACIVIDLARSWVVGRRWWPLGCLIVQRLELNLCVSIGSRKKTRRRSSSH